MKCWELDNGQRRNICALCVAGKEAATAARCTVGGDWTETVVTGRCTADVQAVIAKWNQCVDILREIWAVGGGRRCVSPERGTGGP